MESILGIGNRQGIVRVDADLGPPRAWSINCSVHGRVLFSDGSGYSSKSDAVKTAKRHASPYHERVEVHTPPRGF